MTPAPHLSERQARTIGSSRLGAKRLSTTMASTLCAAAMSSIALITPAAAAQSTTDKPEASIDAAQTCAPIHMIYANGTFDSSTVDDPNSPRGFFGQLNDSIQAEARDKGLATRHLDGSLDTPITASAVNYNASAGGALLPGVNAKYAADATTYRESMTNGVEEAYRQVKEVAENCEDTLFGFGGYSQGAEVIETLARRIGDGKGPIDPDRVVGVALFASPSRQAGIDLKVDGDSAVRTGDTVEKTTEGLSEYPAPVGGGLSFDKSGSDGLGALEDRTVSWCLNGDIVCGLPVESDRIRTIIDAAEDADLTDPLATLDQLSQGVSQAVSATGVAGADIKTVDFGDEGFSLDDATPAVAQDDAEDAATTDADSTGSTGSTGSSNSETEESTTATTSDPAPSSSTPSTTSTPTPRDSDNTSGTAPGGSSTGSSAPAGPSPLQSLLNSARQTSAELETEDSYTSTGAYDVLDGVAGLADGAAGMITENLPDAPQAPAGSPQALAQQTAQDIGSRLMPALTDIGGMALGATVTTTKRTLTPQNLAQIAAAGVTAGPEAAGAVTLAKFTEQGRLLLTPENGSRFTTKALTSLQQQGLDDSEIAELSVTLANWKSLNEHVEYTNRPMMADGRTASAATADWIVAAAQDAGASAPQTTTATAPSQAPGSETGAESADGSGEVPAELGESTSRVDFDTQAASDALAEFTTAETDTTSSASQSASSSESSSESSSTSRASEDSTDESATDESAEPSEATEDAEEDAESSATSADTTANKEDYAR